MRRAIPIMLLVLICACTITNYDPTPSWDQNNRFALEMNSNCNGLGSVLGINGCTYIDSVNEGHTVRFPALWEGSLKLVSAHCGEYNYQVKKNESLTIPLTDLYRVTDKESCSFAITRTVSIGGKYLDNTIIGRFIIKIIPANSYYSKLRFSIDGRLYEGVGFAQKKYQLQDSALTIQPRGNSGTFLMYCGENLIKKIEYNSPSFIVPVDGLEDCDYEISTINSDNPYLEFATYVHITNKYTENITPPEVRATCSGDTEFLFPDRDKTGKGYAVVAINVNNKFCTGNTCTLDSGSSSYTVRAVTMNGRYFLGIYTPATEQWEIK